MGTDSNIEWTDHTFNPWWGCLEVSPGCAHCYAKTLAHRYGFDVWGPAATTERRMMGEQYWKTPTKWNKDAAKTGVRKRVFCASMADVFEDHPQVAAARVRLFDLIKATPNLDWLLLTKRPQNIKAMLPADWDNGYSNVWLGTSVENQEQADTRIPELVAIPAIVRFLSCEPLLGPVNLGLRGTVPSDISPRYSVMSDHIHWVIAGGESGHNARPMHPDWARELRDQCNEAGVAFHFKQWGEHAPSGERVGKKGAGRLLDGRTWDEMPNGVERE